jgi:hypothetical protein
VTAPRLTRELRAWRKLFERAARRGGVEVGRELRRAFAPDERAPLAPLLRPPAAAAAGAPAAAAAGAAAPAPAEIVDDAGNVVGWVTISPVDERGPR